MEPPRSISPATEPRVVGMKKCIIKLERRVAEHDKILGSMKEASEKTSNEEASTGMSLKDKITEDLRTQFEDMLRIVKIDFEKRMELLQEENSKLQKQISEH